MKNRLDLWIGVTLLVLNVTLLALPNQLEAQRRAAGTARVGWLERLRPTDPEYRLDGLTASAAGPARFSLLG